MSADHIKYVGIKTHTTKHGMFMYNEHITPRFRVKLGGWQF